MRISAFPPKQICTVEFELLGSLAKLSNAFALQKGEMKQPRHHKRTFAFYTADKHMKTDFSTSAMQRNVMHRLASFVRATAAGLCLPLVHVQAQGTCPSLTLTVTTTADSGVGSLRQAILDANACPDTNTIVFAPSAYGTITLLSGELLVTNSVNILGPGPDNLAVDGNSPTTTNRVFEIGPGIEVTIAGIRITKGSADSGGGILSVDSSLIVSNCSVVANSVGYKGGGGGIGSVAQDGPAALYVINSTISSNSMGFFGIGGGIVSAARTNATLTVLNSTLSHNVGDAGSSGLGIACLGFGDTSVQIVNSTLSSNSTPDSGTGGGVVSVAYAGTSLIQIMNSTLSDNSAGSGGSGGGIANGAFDGTATVQVVSTVLKAGAFGANFANGGLSGAGQASITSLGFNLSSDDGGGYLDQSNDLLNTDPMLGPLQDNGGPTFTHALPCGSPAIDAGTNFALLATDQRGNGFLRSFGAGTDIGAFESQQLCNKPPVAMCANVTVSADSNCAADASIDNGSFDPDAGDTITNRVQTPPGPYGLGTNLVILTVTDSHGASSSCQGTVIVVDTTPPSIHCPGNVTNIAMSASGMMVTYPAATASDNCSTPTITYSKVSGSVFVLGPTTVTCTATDTSSNSETCTFEVKVIYSWSGVLQPIHADGSSVFKVGSTVPVKFQLTGASAGINNALAKFSYAKLSSSLAGGVNEPTSTTAPTTGNLFRYDPNTQQYIFNWSTKGLTTGAYRLQIDLGDGVSRSINVGLK
jgi:hypothetical protein